eukprot:TRINITY_DN4353_c0_g3_i6.p1 TRINITY_DN4353_c0_g3~~TRINITY_DN4353_c0_g3_i6.p1  ORF type:complete len:190 (-),score=52.24 TRINITY_DN4353_c0_g3_i6:527-1096(-)
MFIWILDFGFWILDFGFWICNYLQIAFLDDDHIIRLLPVNFMKTCCWLLSELSIIIFIAVETTWGDEFENACEDFASHQKTPPTSPSKALTDSQRHARAMTDFLETHTREQSWDSIGKDENKDQEQEQDYVFETVSFSDIRDSDEEDTEKKKAFQNRRKAHYNEYLMISRLRQDDDEDEEESAQTSSAN